MSCLPRYLWKTKYLLIFPEPEKADRAISTCNNLLSTRDGEYICLGQIKSVSRFRWRVSTERLELAAPKLFDDLGITCLENYWLWEICFFCYHFAQEVGYGTKKSMKSRSGIGLHFSGSPKILELGKNRIGIFLVWQQQNLARVTNSCDIRGWFCR